MAQKDVMVVLNINESYFMIYFREFVFLSYKNFISIYFYYLNYFFPQSFIMGAN
jgi:hypothetical protein